MSWYDKDRWFESSLGLFLLPKEDKNEEYSRQKNEHKAKTLSKIVRSKSKERSKASKITDTEKHIPNLVRSEDREARDNASSNVLPHKKEIEVNDKVVSTAEKKLTLPKTVRSEN